MANLSCILIVTAAQRDGVNAVLDAMGWGTPALTVPLTTASPALENSPITHWTLHDVIADTVVATLQALQAGDLPAISGQWGVNGVIAAADAQAACHADYMQVYSASGTISATEHLAGILEGRSLSKFPDPEI